MRKLVLLGLVAGAAAVAPAQIGVRFLGTAYGSPTVTVGAPVNETAYCSVMDMQFTAGGAGFYALCADLTGVVYGNDSWTSQVQLVTADWGGSALQRAAAVMVANGMDEGFLGGLATAQNPTNDVDACAAQLAVWESMNGGISYTINSSDATLVGDIQSQANAYITAAENYAGNAHTIYYGESATAPFEQGQMVYDTTGRMPTPEPFTVGLGIAALGLALRRRLR